MTRILISADMEGITGITCPADVKPGARRWELMRKMLMSDVNAAVRGFFAGGATEVVVNDAHADKRNLLLDTLDERAFAIIGTHKPLGMMQGVEEADAVAFVGYHAGAGRQGVLSHTFIAKTIVDVTINAEPACEGRMNALLAAEVGVPVILFTGDDLACASASTWAPGATEVVVKICVDRYTARCLPPSRTTAMIEEAARRAVRSIEPPPRPEGPFTYAVEFDAAQAVVASTAIPGVKQIGERAVAFTLPTMRDAIRCFKAVSVLAAASREPDFD